MKHSMTVLFIAAGLVLTACGESAEDEAKAQVCDARADIRKQVDELQGLTRTTASVDGVTENLQAIKGDLGKIKDAQGDLGDERKKQVQAANQAFEAQVNATVKDVATSLTAGQAETQLRSAVGQLADSYKQTLGQVDCA